MWCMYSRGKIHELSFVLKVQVEIAHMQNSTEIVTSVCAGLV